MKLTADQIKDIIEDIQTGIELELTEKEQAVKEGISVCDCHKISARLNDLSVQNRTIERIWTVINRMETRGR